MTTWFIGDTHLSHRLMVEKGLRPFATMEEHDEAIIANWNGVVAKDDKVFHLGDVVFQPATRHPLVGRLNGRKHLVMGNHDLNTDVLQYFDRAYGVVEYRGYILSHIPVHQGQLQSRYKGNVHGHLHSALVTKVERRMGTDWVDVPDPRYANVSAEQINYTPISWEALKERQGW